MNAYSRPTPAVRAFWATKEGIDPKGTGCIFFLKGKHALRLVGGITAGWAIVFVAVATLAYSAADPKFSFFTTYLSDIGDSPGWPAVIFNAGTLIAAPMRLLFLMLVVICLNHLGAGIVFLYTALFIGVISTTGTIMMTAVPYSYAPAVHQVGIPMYFWGVVLLQAIVGAREWSLPKCPNKLAVASFSVAAVFLVFGGLLSMVQAGHLNRSAPVIWEWLAYATSVAWVVIHTVVLSSPGAPHLNKVHFH